MRLRSGILLLLAAAAVEAQSPAASPSALERDLERLAVGEGLTNLPPADSVAPGPVTIAAGTVVRGSVVARGPIVVAGRVEGDAVSLHGDVTVRPGGAVLGTAIAVAGHVDADSGEVGGELRSLSSLPRLGRGAAGAGGPPARRRTVDNVRLVAGTFAILLVVAAGVLLFAAPNLEGTTAVLRQRFARSFWTGLLTQLLVLPGLVVLGVALALTLIGVLLIPFAVVAYGIAVIGLATLGFLAAGQLVGDALRAGREPGGRAATFGAVAAGVAVFFALWMLAALLTWAPFAAAVVRAAALAATWAATTLGLGAAVLSRAGSRRRPASAPASLAAWQTPTPVSGVGAARRTAAPLGER